ncbi:hypothetical protein YPPY42_0891, partial [Yersinia pestis PY-42]
MLIIRRPYFSL